MKQGQKPHDREVGFDWLPPTVLQTENREKACQHFSQNNGKSLATDLKEKMDHLGNMFASCCPITFTQPHGLI